MAVIGLVLVAACGGGAYDAPAPVQNFTASPKSVPNSATAAATPLLASTRTLAAGEFQLPAANAFGAPGFHEVLTATHELPPGLGPMKGLRVVLELWDAGRPGVDCGSEHPLSGCATVDWSDAEGRPNVPSGGVFDNSITFQTEAGMNRFFLSESGALNDKPDGFDPG